MSIEVDSKPNFDDEYLYSYIGARIETIRKTELKFDGPEPTDEQAVKESEIKIRSSCPLMGECALKTTCTDVTYDVRSPFGWMQTETEHFLSVIVTDSEVMCPNPNAHVDILNAVMEGRGQEPLDLRT